MASFNKVLLMGNVTRNPDIRNTPNGDKVIASTGLAVNNRYNDDVMFIDIVCFGKQAEVMGSFVQKGTPLLVEGRLTFRTWEKDGIKNSKHEVVIESFQMLGGRKEKVDFEENSIDKEDLKMNPEDLMGEDDVPF